MIQFPIVRTREKEINRGSVTCHKGGGIRMVTCHKGGGGRADASAVDKGVYKNKMFFIFIY